MRMREFCVKLQGAFEHFRVHVNPREHTWFFSRMVGQPTVYRTDEWPKEALYCGKFAGIRGAFRCSTVTKATGVTRQIK